MKMKRIGADGSAKKHKVRKLDVKGGREHWTNDSVKMITEIDCYVPTAIEKAMKALDLKFPRSEFSIACKSNYNENSKTVEVDPEYFIPKQSVSGASVDYEEDMPNGYDVIIHKHPNGCRNFSGTDDTYINQNFDFSLLWEGGSFVKGQARIRTKFGFFKVALNIKIEPSDLPDIPQEMLSKIKERVVYVNKYMRPNQRGGWQDWDNFMSRGYHNNGSFGGSVNNKPFNPTIQKKQTGLLSNEQEEVNTFLNEQEEEYLDYIESVNTIMQENKGMSWDDAEKLFRKGIKATDFPALDLSKDDLGIINFGRNDNTKNCVGPTNQSHVKRIVGGTQVTKLASKDDEILKIMKEKNCERKVAEVIYTCREANNKK